MTARWRPTFIVHEVPSPPRYRTGTVALTMEMLLCARGLARRGVRGQMAARRRGRGRRAAAGMQSSGRLLSHRRARRARAGTYEEFRAKLPKNFKLQGPRFYVAAPLPVELIHTIMQFADGRTLARFSICSPQLRVRADKIASEGLARITTLRLGQPAVADWRTELRLFAVLTNPPNDPVALRPRHRVGADPRPRESTTPVHKFLVYLDERTNYGLEDHRAYMVKYALQCRRRRRDRGRHADDGPGRTVECQTFTTTCTRARDT